ncbi:MAG TPA: tetratricopeptide repeat protein [Anaerolineales bacterium]|nr:tetratricopeptide repeat protein [Anaerolineales bacterium]
MTGKSNSPKKPRAKKRSASSGDNYDLSGDFRGAVVNIQSTIVSNAEVKDLENLPPEPGDPPFQGLQYFDEKDADRFFGREAVVAKIVGRLTTTRFLTVIGASGSGKSSVVRAGVLPALRRGERLADGSLPPTDSGQWDIRILTPSAHPLDALAASLTRDSDSLSAITALHSELVQAPTALSLIARQVLAQNNKKHLLLIIDQFEEVFTQCRQEDEQRAFIENLLHAIDPADPQPVTVLVTLRADFYSQLAFHDRLRELVSQNQEFIGAMNREELTRAILQPAALGNWKVQEGLVEVILDDLGSEPGALPLLSHALLETWKRRRGRVLTVSGYTEAGGVRGAIAQTAETVFRQRLSPEQQPVARMIFVKLAEMGEDSLDTRRRAAFSELITRATDTSTIDAVLGILTDARLVTTGTLEPGDTRVVEVAHEALIREWPTLRDWLNQNRQGLILHRQLTEDTNDWIKLERDPGALYRGIRLKQTLEWVKTNPELISLTEQEFLDASQNVARKEAGQSQKLARARWIQALLAVIVVVVILAVTNAFAPRVMPAGTFNIAVAEFGEMDSNGEIRSSDTGRIMSGWAVNYLRSELKKEDANLVVWPNESTLFTRTHVRLVEPDTAGATASTINADLLLYGYIDTRADPPQLILNFWIAPQDQYKFEDIQGNLQIGKPIRVVNLNDPGISVQGELERQSTALAWIAIGLAQEQLGQTEDALQAFLKAGESVPSSEMVQFFIGREYLFLSEAQPDRQEDLWQAAEEALLQAVTLNDQYARAYIGLGALYRKRSDHLVDLALAARQAVDPQATQWIEQAIESYKKVLELQPAPEQYGNPVEEVARLALGNAYRQKGVIALINGDVASALEAFDEAIRLLEASRPVFVAAVPEHESYRRYLTQAYEYLGSAYQWQGRALEAAQEYDRALISYQKSIEAFNQCISQGELSPDLVIQNDIVAKNCGPYLEETQQTYNELIGGQ